MTCGGGRGWASGSRSTNWNVTGVRIVLRLDLPDLRGRGVSVSPGMPL